MNNTKKQRIYLDTSAISYLKQDDAIEQTLITKQFWKSLKNRKDIEIFLSDVTIEELLNCYEPKKSYLLERMKEINYQVIKISDEIKEMAERIIADGILTQKSHDDCLHIASAIVRNCDIIVSWNFKHLVNAKTIKGIRKIDVENCKTIDIFTPKMMLEEDEND